MKGLVHSGITVSNLERSVSFYRDVLGLKLIKIEPPRDSRSEMLGVENAVVHIAVLEMGDSKESIELIEFKSPEPPNQYGTPVNSIGQVHLAFRIEDIEASIADLKKKGVEFVSENYEEIVDGPLKGWKWIYFKDPDGVNLELIEEG
jgi:catechol 2,3-dioxygenase-like lactoylglutathione lyase family enzyme